MSTTTEYTKTTDRRWKTVVECGDRLTSYSHVTFQELKDTIRKKRAENFDRPVKPLLPWLIDITIEKVRNEGITKIVLTPINGIGKNDYLE